MEPDGDRDPCSKHRNGGGGVGTVLILQKGHLHRKLNPQIPMSPACAYMYSLNFSAYDQFPAWVTFLH